MTIRLVHLYAGPDGESHFTDGTIGMTLAGPGSEQSIAEPVQSAMFEETAAGSSLSWHNAPARQYVLTQSGTLEFETRGGERCTLRPGDVLLVADTTGGGHRWRLVDDQPWRRMYITR